MKLLLLATFCVVSAVVAQGPFYGLEERLAVLENAVRLLTDENRDNRYMCEDVDIKRCLSMQTESDYTTLDATGPGTWPRAELCRVVSRENRVNLDQYVYTVELYNQAGLDGINSGHIGVAYNVIDVDNFDFVYFRPHHANDGRCLQHGYVISGAFHGTSEDRCTGAPVRGGTWFKVKVESSHGRASVYVNDVNLSEVNAHFPTRSQTGIIVANGYRNVIRFRNSALTAL
nr:lectin 2-4 [Arenicola marina]